MLKKIEATIDGERFRGGVWSISGNIDYTSLDWWHPVTMRWIPVESQVLRDSFWNNYTGAFESLSDVINAEAGKGEA